MNAFVPPTTSDMASVFAALSQPTRLEAYRLLLRYQPFGLAAGDISRLLSVPHNTLSTHLRALEACGLVRSRKDGRSIIFVADAERFEDAAVFLGLSEIGDVPKVARERRPRFPHKRPQPKATERVYNVLILCSGNSARSLIAEAIVNREGHGRFHAFSAGSKPRRRPHPLAIKLLKDLGYDTADLIPKSWADFALPDAPEMDFVITVCDRTIGENCPSWPGHPLVSHWGIPSVAELSASHAESVAAFRQSYRHLMNRFTELINLPVDELTLDGLRRRLDAIGGMQGATEKALIQADL